MEPKGNISKSKVIKSNRYKSPSFISCACASCAISFGVIFLLSGLVLNALSSVSPTSPFRDNPYFLPTRDDFSATPRLISIILMSIGGALILLSIVFMVISLVWHRKSTKRQNNTIKFETTNQTISQSNQSINNLRENEVVFNEIKGDINTIGLPINIPHNGFSYTSYPPVYIQKKNNSTKVFSCKESQI